MKRLMCFVLAMTMLLTACSKTNNDRQNIDDSTVTSYYENLQFNSLEDEFLHDYIKDLVYNETVSALNSKEYFVDMLFANRKLNCLVAVDLKIGEFRSEYVGKMNMYLSLLDKIEKEEHENQSIGIILCAEKDHLDVELALQDVNKPIAVSDYELVIPRRELQSLVLNEMRKLELSR